MSMEGNWPWWLGAAVLAAVAVGFAVSMRRSFGVSGIYARLLSWREERQAEKVQRYLEQKHRALGEDAATGPMPVSVGLTFVAFIFAGGLVSHLFADGATIRFALGDDFARLVGSGVSAWLWLLAGGFLVGFGTRMAGGCTSGHGLFGCARLQPASLLATASFFGAAVAVSFVLSGMS